MKEFVIETASPPARWLGRPRSNLRLMMEQMRPGQVLRWRSPSCKKKAISSVIHLIKQKDKTAAWHVRKETGGFDIYRLEGGHS